MKNFLRQKFLAYRSQLAPAEIDILSRRISARLLTLLQSLPPCTVGLFYPSRGEPDILHLIDNPSLARFVWALPVCCFSSGRPVLKFAKYEKDTALETGRYHIPVPALKNWVVPQVLLIPCVGFHRNGVRLGYGAGWYDQTLAHHNPVPIAVGVAYSLTETNCDFSQSHDCLLNYIVTDDALIDPIPGQIFNNPKDQE